LFHTFSSSRTAMRGVAPFRKYVSKGYAEKNRTRFTERVRPINLLELYFWCPRTSFLVPGSYRPATRVPQLAQKTAPSATTAPQFEQCVTVPPTDEELGSPVAEISWLSGAGTCGVPDVGVGKPVSTASRWIGMLCAEPVSGTLELLGAVFMDGTLLASELSTSIAPCEA